MGVPSGERNSTSNPVAVRLRTTAWMPRSRRGARSTTAVPTRSCSMMLPAARCPRDSPPPFWGTGGGLARDGPVGYRFQPSVSGRCGHRNAEIRRLGSSRASRWNRENHLRPRRFEHQTLQRVIRMGPAGDDRARRPTAIAHLVPHIRVGTLRGGSRSEDRRQADESIAQGDAIGCGVDRPASLPHPFCSSQHRRQSTGCEVGSAAGAPRFDRPHPQHFVAVHASPNGRALADEQHDALSVGPGVQAAAADAFRAGRRAQGELDVRQAHEVMMQKSRAIEQPQSAGSARTRIRIAQPARFSSGAARSDAASAFHSIAAISWRPATDGWNRSIGES